jgi:hypothetical protein
LAAKNGAPGTNAEEADGVGVPDDPPAFRAAVAG